MKYLILIVLMTITATMCAEAYVTGVDDVSDQRKVTISEDAQKKLDDSILTYYRAPSVTKVDTILDIMTDTTVLERKTAWAPLVGFFTEVFPKNKDHVMGWISRNDYNTYAQYIIVNALLHAKMKETAMLFAKAHKWSPDELFRLHENDDNIDLKKLRVVIPGHIDTLWGAFFASGDEVYIEKIIDSLMQEHLPVYAKNAFLIPDDGDTLKENKMLAATTLRDYARDDAVVRSVLEKHYNAEPAGSPKKEIFKEILGK